MNRPMTEQERRRAEQIVRRWAWAVRLSTPADRTVEQCKVAEMAVDLLAQLLDEGRLESERLAS